MMIQEAFFLGTKKRKRYFEGWYFKCISADSGGIEGQLDFFDIQLFPWGKNNPGIMGPFTNIPFMECYHAIIHLAHRISGEVKLDKEVLDFNGGVGYIEKDYGRSFPETYIWIQAGHFKDGDACFVFSRAKIPFLGTRFTGYFAYFTDFNGLTHRFATYNRSKFREWEVDVEAGYCAGKLKNSQAILEFKAKMDGGGRLRAPVEGLMDREIIESIRAEVFIRLTDQAGKVLFKGRSDQAGMEISL